MSFFKSATLLSLLLLSSSVFARTPSESSRGGSRETSSVSTRDASSGSSRSSDRNGSASSQRTPSRETTRDSSASSERRPTHTSSRATGYTSYAQPSHLSASIRLPSLNVSIGAPPYANARWVDGYQDRHGIYQAGYWRPQVRHGYVWIDGYRDRHGIWQAGRWVRR